MDFDKETVRYSLLYVDDEAINLLAFKKDFGEDYNLFTAVNTKEGFKILKENEIHLVISDYLMPGVRGTEFLAEVKKKYPEPKLILISAYDDFSILVKAVNDIGIFRFIGKPYEPKDFRQVITNALYNYQLEKDKNHSKKILIESQKKLLAAQNVARMGFLDWDLKTDKLELSAELVRLYGLDLDEKWSSADLFKNIIHPDDYDFVSKHLDLTKQKGCSQSFDHRIVRPDGKILWMHAAAELLTDSESKPISLVLTAIDITERKMAEAELEQHREHLEDLVRERTQELKLSETRNMALLDAVPDMIFQVRRDGTYVEFIPGKNMKTIVPVSDFIGKNIRDIISAETADLIMETIELTLHTRKVHTAEYQFLISDEVHYREARFIGLGKDEVMIIERDVSERKKAEESLKRHSEELENFNNIMVDREMRIIELKEEVNKLAAEAGREEPYPPDWEEDNRNIMN